MLSKRKKTEYVKLVTEFRCALDTMFHDLSEMLAVTETSDFTHQPFNAMAAKFVQELYHGEHGQLLRATREKFHELCARLEEHEHTDAFILSFMHETAALIPDVQKLDEQLSNLPEQIEQRRQAVMELN